MTGKVSKELGFKEGDGRWDCWGDVLATSRLLLTRLGKSLFAWEWPVQAMCMHFSVKLISQPSNVADKSTVFYTCMNVTKEKFVRCNLLTALHHI